MSNKVLNSKVSIKDSGVSSPTDNIVSIDENGELKRTTQIVSDIGKAETNLTYTASPVNGVVNSDTGTNAVIPIADATNAGLMKANFYEEGSFVPVLSDQSGTAIYNTGSVLGKYIRTGNNVCFNIEVNSIDQIGVATGYFAIKGMPFDYEVAGSSGIAYQFIKHINNSGLTDLELSLLKPVSTINGRLIFIYDNSASAIANLLFTTQGSIRVSGTYKTDVYTE